MPQSDDPLPPNLLQELRSERQFSLSEAIGRAGGSFLKSEAAIPRPLRALAAINLFIDQHLVDTNGALQDCLKRWVKTDMQVGRYLDQPLLALQVITCHIVEHPSVLYEFSRQVAVQWGELNGERPYFQKPGAIPHPKVVYSHETVRQTLIDLTFDLAKTIDADKYPHE